MERFWKGCMDREHLIVGNNSLEILAEILKLMLFH